jgi:hypothetical protein
MAEQRMARGEGRGQGVYQGNKAGVKTQSLPCTFLQRRVCVQPPHGTLTTNLADTAAGTPCSGVQVAPPSSQRAATAMRRKVLAPVPPAGWKVSFLSVMATSGSRAAEPCHHTHPHQSNL